MRRCLLAIALCPLLTGCGAYVRSTEAVPSTTTTSVPDSGPVPAFGSPAGVLPATATNAMTNASGACSAFDVLYISAAQQVVPAAAARSHIAQANVFAAAAATGDPPLWTALSHDLAALSTVIASPAWLGSASQDQLPSVHAVYIDCRPLE